MANTKISALSSATTPLSGSEIVPINQSGVTDSVTVANLTAGRTVNASALGVGVTTPASGKTIEAQNGAASTGIRASNNGGGYVEIVCESNATSNAQLNYTNQITASGGDFRLSSANFIPTTAGKGINFTANTPASGMTSQNLTWYETGTFTPTLTTDGSPSTTYTTQTGQYTRFGNIVYIQIGIVWTAFSGTGNVLIGGLPFAAVLSNPTKTISIPVTSSTNTSLVNYSLSDFRTSGSYTSLYLYSFNGNVVSTTTVGSSGTITVKGFYFC